MKAKNIKEAKELIKRYESITLEEIKKAFSELRYDFAENLTGFGSASDCILCKAVQWCKECIYIEPGGCFEGENKESYYRIYNTDTPTKLRNAYRARAKHIRKLIGYEKTI